MRKNAYTVFSFIAVFFVFFPCAVQAQNIPPGDQPGAQGSRFQAESTQEKKRVEKKKAQPPQIEIEKAKEKPSAEPGPSFTLRKVSITGSTIFKPLDFQSSYQPYVGKPVTFKDLEDIAAAIKAVYKKKGYLSTDAYLPEQDISQGEVEIRVIEGTLGDVKVEGNKWFDGALLRKYIHIKKNELLDIFKLQRDMLRLNQNPDLQVTAVVSPGREQSSTDVILKVKDKNPYHAGMNFDNQGTRLVGKYRTSAVFRSTNVTGWYDSCSVNALMSNDSTGEFISYTIPLDTYGTRAGIDLVLYDMKLGREYKSSDITGSTRIMTPHLSRELSLSEDFQAYMDAGIDIKSIEKRTAGELVTNDEIRMPYVAFDLAKMDRFWGAGQTVFSPRFSLSTRHFLGASSRNHPTASRPDTGGFFVKYEQTLKRTQRVAFNSVLSVRSQFQAASHTLPSSEQFQLGGANSVRGYPEGEFLADVGGTLNTEWSFPSAIKPLKKYLYPVLFMDMGLGKLKKTGAGERSNKFLMGAGAGLRFQINNNFFLRADWAKHLEGRPSHGQGPSTFYISAQSEI